MLKRTLLQIFIFINDTRKSALEVWINGDVNGYICRGSILKRPTYVLSIVLLGSNSNPTSPCQLPMLAYVPLLYLSLSPTPLCVASKA
jgi:hypothetical protein